MKDPKHKKIEPKGFKSSLWKDMFHVCTKVHVRIEWNGGSMVLTRKYRVSYRKVRLSRRHVLSGQSSQVVLS